MARLAQAPQNKPRQLQVSQRQQEEDRYSYRSQMICGRRQETSVVNSSGEWLLRIVCLDDFLRPLRVDAGGFECQYHVIQQWRR